MAGASSYEALEQRFARIGALREAARMLAWDRSVNMPPRGAPARAEQLAALRLVEHEKITDPAVPDLLDGAAEEVAGDAWRAANLREMRRRWVHATALDGGLIAAMERADSECEMAWREAQAQGRLRRRQTLSADGARSGSRGRAGARRGARLPGLRRADGRVRAGRADRADRRAVRRPRRLPPRISRPRAGGAGARGAAFADGGSVRGRGAARARRSADGTARLRFRRRAPRCQPAPVLQRGSRRRPGDDTLRHGGLHPERHGRPARDRARALQQGAAARLAPPAGGLGARHGGA